MFFVASTAACTTVPSATSTAAGGGDATSGSSTTTTADTTAASSTGTSGCSESPCKLTLPQCGCDQDHQCSIVGAERECVPKGGVAIGEPCNGSVCEPGAACLGLGADARCAKFCSSDADCEGPGGACALTTGDGMGMELEGVKFCTENCDPATSTGCASLPGSGCQLYPDAGGTKYFTRCEAAGAETLGACNANSECAPSFTCATECYAYCVIGGQACPGLMGCLGLSPPAILNGDEYGICNGP